MGVKMGMIEIVLTGRKVDDILAIVKDLRAQGLQQRVDFDFKWQPPVNDWLNNANEQSRTIFYFYQESLATLFALKWA